MTKRRLLLACFILSLAATSARATGALDYTRSTLEQAQAIIASGRNHNVQLADLSSLFNNFFDTDYMAREALGDYWPRLSPTQQKEFLHLFRNLMQRAYVQKLLLFETPQFAYLGETPVNGEVRVATSITTPHDDFSVDYQLRPIKDRWLATSITVENVNLTSNLSAQLRHVLAKSSVEDLLDLMRRKFGDAAGDSQ